MTNKTWLVVFAVIGLVVLYKIYSSGSLVTYNSISRSQAKTLLGQG